MSDPELDTIEVFRHVDACYRRVAELPVEAGEALTSPLFPDLKLPLSKIVEN